MSDYYVRPTVGSDTNGGTSWASDSWATLKKATDTVTAGDHTIWISSANADVITTSTTYTLAEGVKIVSTSDGTTYASGASVTSTTFGVDIEFRGKGTVFGLALKAATSGTSTLDLCTIDESSLFFADCIFDIPSTTATPINIGTSGLSANVSVVTRNCKWRFGAAGSSIAVLGRWRSYGDAFADSGTVPTTLITDRAQNTTDIYIEGGNLSALSSKTILANTSRPLMARFVSCLFPATFTPLASGAASLGAAEIELWDCSYDNAGTLTGHLLYHQNYLGATSVSTAIYATDGAQYDGTNRCTWFVDGSANANYNRHYISPWIDAYNADTSTAVTPSLEIVRDGSASAFNNDDVWLEVAYRGTANSPVYTYANDARGVVSSNAAQATSSKGAGDWTGEGGTAWFGTLALGSTITPAEVGHIRARVCVAGNYDFYVDPTIRGLA